MQKNILALPEVLHFHVHNFPLGTIKQYNGCRTSQRRNGSLAGLTPNTGSKNQYLTKNNALTKGLKGIHGNTSWEMASFAFNGN